MIDLHAWNINTLLELTDYIARRKRLLHMSWAGSRYLLSISRLCMVYMYKDSRTCYSCTVSSTCTSMQKYMTAIADFESQCIYIVAI